MSRFKNTNFPLISELTLLQLVSCFGPHHKAITSLANDHENKLTSIKFDEKDQLKWSEYQKTYPVEKLQEILITKGIKFLSIYNPQYPDSLKKLFSPPAILYYIGTFPKLDTALACIGTRQISNYGQFAVQKLLSPFSKTGGLIVSGLAIGVDSSSHQVAVINKKPTVAVLGGSPESNCLYPRSNLRLSQEILNNGGCLLSEYPPDTKPFKHHFIARNRIIAGLSKAVLVIECAKKSGALITVNYALELNRDCLAVPGPIWSKTSEGTNQLIKEGAIPITDPEEILNYFQLSKDLTNVGDLNEQEKQIFQLISDNPKSLEELLFHKDAYNIISSLELKGLIKNIGDQVYVKIVQ